MKAAGHKTYSLAASQPPEDLCPLPAWREQGRWQGPPLEPSTWKEKWGVSR